MSPLPGSTTAATRKARMKSIFSTVEATWTRPLARALMAWERAPSTTTAAATIRGSVPGKQLWT